MVSGYFEDYALMEPEFTLTLIRRELGAYTVRGRFRTGRLDDGDDIGQETTALDLDLLNEARLQPDQYARLLTAAVFKGDVLRVWGTARATAGPLRVRLELDDTALELHRLRWETLLVPPVPADGQAATGMLTDQNVWFSRFLSSREPLRGRSRVMAEARVLVAVASLKDPADPDAFNYDAELAKLRSALKGLTAERNITTLPDPALGRATFKNILDRLAEGDGYDVLYLVAHGVLDGPEPKLFLEDDAGKRKVVNGSELAVELGKLRSPPRLVVLSSCQSAGPDRPTEDVGLDAALGPRIGRAGIPSVVAMFGSVAQATANRFVGKFFEELRKDGRVDRAAAAARFDLKDAAGKYFPDYWSPILYTRLVTNRLWLTIKPDLPDWWPNLLRQLKAGRCIPVIGSGVLDPLVGSPAALAAQLLGDDGRADAGRPPTLTEAAQYVGTMRTGLRTAYLDALKAAVAAQRPNLPTAADLGPVAPPQMNPGSPFAASAETVRGLLAAAADQVAAAEPPEPHQVLARLRCPVYISTNPDDLLARELDKRIGPAADGKSAVDVQVCNWLYDPAHKTDPTATPPGSPADPPRPPTPDRPLVCHLFGHLCDPQTIVLTEDEYFKFLVGMARENEAKKSAVVKKASVIDAQLTQSGLLFLGFRLDDWDFRAFLAAFLSREAAYNRWGWGEDEVLDVAVQLDPEDGLNADPARVRQYLDRLFGRSRIRIYWVSTREFLAELAAAFPAAK